MSLQGLLLMKKTNLGSICNVTTGKLDSNAALEDGEYPFFTCAPYPSKIDHFAFDCDAILVAGNNAAGNFHLNRFRGKFNAYQRTYVLTAKPDWDIDFIYYALKYEIPFLKFKSQGSQTKFLTMGLLLEIPVPNISLNEQRNRIALVRLMQEKIDLLKKRIEVSEQFMNCLYEFWFLNYEYPVNGKGSYSDSGGKFRYDKTLKRDIPVDWQVRKLGDVVSSINTGLNPRSNFELNSGDNFYVTIKNISQGLVILDSKCDKISNDALTRIDARSKLEAGDILFTSIEPVGITYFVPEKPTNWNINESVFSIKADKTVVCPEFLYFVVSSFEMKNYTSNLATGSIHKGIRHFALRDFNCVIPPLSLQEEFCNIVRPMLVSVDELKKQIIALQNETETLLPLIMECKLKVK